MTIGSTTYSIQTTLSGTSPANQVLDGGSGASGHLATTTNLRAAMLNNSSACSNAPSACFRNVSAANSTVTPGSAANPLTLHRINGGRRRQQYRFVRHRMCGRPIRHGL